ncbi:DUF2087 domain-containing protein [Dactylosporangium aurantiacum]|uniref:DUF2087 domain-containing protein n=1 Tax=Dactylosporangium aurantiacum TaxID=35754 RepID=UPI0007C4CFAA|nr:DUF2087 domain-containing protein [Dactylosporangium aurantiacum]MDG6104842.1 DUF2087 domain-containing protein [Dactylosporangium aurantiacum]
MTASSAASPAASPAALCGLLAEEDRLRVYAAVVLGASGLTEIESATGLPARTVAAAVARLQQGGLLGLAGGALRADVEVFKDSVRAHAAAPPPAEPMDPDRQRDQILRTFVVDGRLTHLPAAHGKRQVVLEHIAASFEPGIRYPEREVNAVLRAWHDDYAALRRYLVDSDLLSRADGTYWRTGGPVAV